MKKTESIQWHENCFNNWKNSLDKHEERTLKELAKIKQDRERLNFYEDQIKSAKITGKAEFDRERYKVKRKPLTLTPSPKAQGMELTLNPIPSTTDNQKESSGTKPSTRGI